jgi:hypothetical protein
MGVVVFLLMNFGLPVYWGATSAHPVYAALWAAGMAVFGIAIGWRAPNQGLIASFLVALAFSFSTCTFAYVLGYGVAKLVW